MATYTHAHSFSHLIQNNLVEPVAEEVNSQF